MNNSLKSIGKGNNHNLINPRQILARNTSPRINNLNAATAAAAAAGSNPFVPPPTAATAPPPTHVLPPPRHHTGAHYQMHQQMYMDRMRMPAPNQPNDFYYSEMHSSTWQYSSQPQFFANIAPQAGGGNMQILPNLSVPPPPYGMFPGNGGIYAGYASFQTNSGFIGPNGAVVTNSVGAMGAVGTFGGPFLSNNGRNVNTACGGSSEGTPPTSNTSRTSSNGSNSSMGAVASNVQPFPYGGLNMNSNMVAGANIAKPKTCDASVQVDILPNVPPLERLSRNTSTSSSSSNNQSQFYGVSHDDFDFLTMCSSINTTTSSIGAGDGEVGAATPNAAAGPATGTSTVYVSGKQRKNSEVLLSQQKLHDVTRVSLRGSELAEKLAYVHRNRPCFKKIDSLCARMKQDLIRPDGVLPNINSQGIAWAVKDFIFVFTRIVNAWIIMKGYIYNTPDGLNKIKNVLPEGFMEAFAEWQDATFIFVEFLIKAFLCLDGLVHHQKASFTKKDENLGNNASCSNAASDNVGPKSSSTPNKASVNLDNIFNDTFDLYNNLNEKTSAESLNKNYLYTMVQDSEETQRHANANGTYFKTGTYQPLQKSEEELDSTSLELLAAALATSANNNPNTAVTIPLLDSTGLRLDTAATQLNHATMPVAETLSVAAPQLQASAAGPLSLCGVPSSVATQAIALNLNDIYDEELTNAIWPVKLITEALPTGAPTQPPPLPPPSQSQAVVAIDSNQASSLMNVTTHTEIVKINHHEQHGNTAPSNWTSVSVEQNNKTEDGSENDRPRLNPSTVIGSQSIQRLSDLGDRILELKNTEAFFKKDFTRNYYSDFVLNCKFDYIDVRSIVLKCHAAEYLHVNEAIHDLRRIIFVVKNYLITKPPTIDNQYDQEQLQTALDQYELEVKNLLNRHPYRSQEYEHIKGEPNEKLFNYVV